MVRDHGHAGGHLHHVTHAGHRLGARGIKGLDRSAEHRRARDHRGQQAVEVHVEAELRAARDLLRRVEPARRLAGGRRIEPEQFLSRDVVLRVAGQDGVSFIERTITVADLLGDYDFEWWASTSQKNAEIRGQQIVNYMMMATKIPPEQLAAQNRRFDWAWLAEQAWTVGFGLRNGERVVVPIVKDDITDWRLENDLFRANRGPEVKLSPKEDHLEHAKGHDLVMQDPRVPDVVKREVAAHQAEHIQAFIAAQAQAMMQAVQHLQPPAPGLPGPNGNGNGARLPPPLGPGRMPQTGSQDDLFRQMPRGTGPLGSLG